jgi:hypothetical protein
MVWVKSFVAKAEKGGALGDLASEQRGARQFDHRTGEVRDRNPFSFHHLAADAVDDLAQYVEFSPSRDQRHHDLQLDRHAGLLHDRGRRLEDGDGLHLVDLGIGDAEPAAAMAEHRVGLIQGQRSLPHLDDTLAGDPGRLVELGIDLRQKFVQGRVEQADRHRQTGHDPEDLGKIGALHR